MAQLGIQGSAEQVGRATASAEGTVTSLYGMAGPVRSLGRRIVSGTDEAAEAAGRTSAAAAGETIGSGRPARVRTGVPSVADGKFAEWFDNLTPDQLDVLWRDAGVREAIKARLRSPGGFHEWLPVARADVYRRWGVTADEIAAFRTPTRQVRFADPVGVHGATGSGIAHNEIIRIVDQARTFEQFIRELRQWADRRLVGGSDALPPGLRP